MRNIFFISGFFVLSLASCEKVKNAFSVSGIYTESTPVAGRSQLNFIDNSLVIKSETGSSYLDTFRYSISAGKIKLTQPWTSQYAGQEFDFEKIDEKTIKIENLYPSIPEAPKSYMTLKK